MFKAFILSCSLLRKALLQALAPRPRSLGRPSAKRVAMLLFFVPVFILVQAFHWIGFLIDEILFRGYRKTSVDNAVFITGVPRSGTTVLHRTLARDSRFTTFSTWELFFGLSVSARKAIMCLGRIDKFAGSPLRRLISMVERKRMASFNQVHHTSLFEPEEDYLALCPIMSCFILVLPFPRLDLLWNMAYFDRSMPEKEKRIILKFYKTCLQKHIYVHGQSKRLLSKNASFSGAIGSLSKAFPDARFICCTRDPAETIPSVLSSMKSGMKMFGVGSEESRFKERMVKTMREYYRNIEQVAGTMPSDRCAVIGISQISGNLEGTVRDLYSRFQLDITPRFAEELRRADKSAKSYRSTHDYSLEEFGIDPEQVNMKFRLSREKARNEKVLSGGFAA